MLQLVFHFNKSLIGNLNNSRASSNRLVSNLVLASCQYNIALSVNAFWNHEFKASLNMSDINVDGTSDCDECSIDRGLAVLWKQDIAWGEEGDGVS